MLAMLLDRSNQNAPNQAMVFNRAVIDAKRAYLEESNKADVLANFTIDSPVPYKIDAVLARLREWDEEMVAGARGDKQGPFHREANALCSAPRLENDRPAIGIPVQRRG